jgi:hypothetical protein
MAQHVKLVGLMGSGKTTIGRRIAALCVTSSTPAALEEIADRSIAEIFEQDGEAGSAISSRTPSRVPGTTAVCDRQWWWSSRATPGQPPS